MVKEITAYKDEITGKILKKPKNQKKKQSD